MCSKHATKCPSAVPYFESAVGKQAVESAPLAHIHQIHVGTIGGIFHVRCRWIHEYTES